MAILVDQANVGEFALDTASSTIVMTTSNVVASGGFIVLVLCWFGSSITLSSVAGGSLTWAIDKTGLNSTTNGAVVSAQAPSGLASSTAITATLSGSAGGARCMFGTSFTGVATSAALGVSDSHGLATAAWSTNSMTIASGSVIVAGSCNFDSLQTSTPTSPSVEAHDAGNGGFSETACYRIEAAGGSFTVAGTWTAAATTGVTIACEYKVGVAAAAAPTFQPHRMPLGV